MIVTMEFEDDYAADEFIGMWLDGGGEQDCGYETTWWDEKKRILKVLKVKEEEEE